MRLWNFNWSLIIDLFSTSLKHVFKCVKPIIPRANNAIFLETSAHPVILEYIKLIPDPNRPNDEHGHIALFGGDSGAPLWRECNNGKAELRAIYKGHNNNKKFPTGRYRHNDEYIASVGLTVQCVNYATKLTKDMVQWITDKDDEYFILDIDVWCLSLCKAFWTEIPYRNEW